MSTLMLHIRGKLAGFCPVDVACILPDESNPKRSVVYTTTIPSGVTVDEDSGTAIVLWENALLPEEDHEEDEEVPGVGQE